MRTTQLLMLAGLIAGPSSVLCRGQAIQFDLGTPATTSHAEHVSLETETLTVPAGKPAWVELRFRVAPGYHINSHQPNDETLIPTAFQAAPGANPAVLHAEFPAGTPYHLQGAGAAVLSTYQGDFNVRLELAPSPTGAGVFAGKLHYQACDSASCFPARDLPVRLVLTAR